jgi:hypothetical protein
MIDNTQVITLTGQLSLRSGEADMSVPIKKMSERANHGSKLYAICKVSRSILSNEIMHIPD